MTTETSSPAMSTRDDTAKALTREPVSFLTRIRFFFRVWFMKYGASMFLFFLRLAARRKRSPLPTYTKTYPVRPTLSNRIFVPKSHNPGTTHRLLIAIHGGGFALLDPSFDDAFNRIMADNHDFVVVSVNYRKAPAHPFPIPVHDTAGITRAILADTDLPVDPSQKPSLLGFSAGGNLILAIAQLPGIKDRVGALVPIYPVVDFTGKFKGPYRSTPDGKPDRLKEIGPTFNWAYIPVGTDLADPLLSPICAEWRAALPQRIFFVGAEYDYLCHEAEIMARSLAFGKFESPRDKVGDLGMEWEKKGVKWRTVGGVVHGWTHMPFKGEEEIVKQNELKRLYREINEWVGV